VRPFAGHAKKKDLTLLFFSINESTLTPFISDPIYLQFPHFLISFDQPSCR
jgi:hypothetical protein